MSNWATELARAMQETSPNIELMLGEVLSIRPLSIRVKGVTICRRLYINPTYVLKTDDEIGTIFNPELPLHPQVFSFLKDWHQNHTLKPNDTIIVLKSDTSFYIAEKVVKV